MNAENLTGVEWWIPHPGNGTKVVCETFEEAMDDWFEGFNIPVRVVDGKPEPSDNAIARVRQYYKGAHLGLFAIKPPER